MDDLKEDCRYWGMDGVRIHKITPGQLAPGRYRVETRCETQPKYALFFCFCGSLALERKSNPVMEIGSQEILLATDISDIEAISIQDTLTGCGISVDPAAAHTTFEMLYHVLGHGDLWHGWVGRMLKKHDGCIHIPHSDWNRSAFSMMGSLPMQEQGPYCVFKSIELIYLLYACPALLEKPSRPLPALAYSPNSIQRVHDYMEEHLDQKLTISSLSHQFHLSPTALKTRFREVYAQPIHSWLVNRRVQKAAALLQLSDLTVLQIAQSVGYESVSQFNVVFKRVYGVSPRLYRKMSDTRSI